MRLRREAVTRAISQELTAMGRGMPVQEAPCPACSDDAYVPAVIRNGFPIVSCRTCGSLYARPRPLEERLGMIYQRFPQLSNGREGQRTDDPEDGRSEAEYRLGRLREVATSGDLLDIGCGRGDFLDAAQEHFDARGVDIAPRLRPHARALRVFVGRLEDASFPDSSFDVVTAVEVLEHMFNPRRTLVEIHRILKPEGILLFQTGDVDSLRARLNLETWTYLQPPVHLNVFSREGLRRLATDLRFERVKTWSFGRAPGRIPVLSRVWRSQALRPALDLAAHVRLIGAMYVWRKEG